VKYVACRREKRSTYRALVGRPEEKKNLVELGVIGRIILSGIGWQDIDSISSLKRGTSDRAISM